MFGTGRKVHFAPGKKDQYEPGEKGRVQRSKTGQSEGIKDQSQLYEIVQDYNSDQWNNIQLVNYFSLRFIQLPHDMREADVFTAASVGLCINAF